MVLQYIFIERPLKSIWEWHFYPDDSSPYLYFQRCINRFSRDKYSITTRVKIDPLCAHFIQEYEKFDRMAGIFELLHELPPCFIIQPRMEDFCLYVEIVARYFSKLRH